MKKFPLILVLVTFIVLMWGCSSDPSKPIYDDYKTHQLPDEKVYMTPAASFQVYSVSYMNRKYTFRAATAEDTRTSIQLDYLETEILEDGSVGMNLFDLGNQIVLVSLGVYAVEGDSILSSDFIAKDFGGNEYVPFFMESRKIIATKDSHSDYRISPDQNPLSLTFPSSGRFNVVLAYNLNDWVYFQSLNVSDEAVNLGGLISLRGFEYFSKGVLQSLLNKDLTILEDEKYTSMVFYDDHSFEIKSGENLYSGDWGFGEEDASSILDVNWVENGKTESYSCSIVLKDGKLYLRGIDQDEIRNKELDDRSDEELRDLVSLDVQFSAQ